MKFRQIERVRDGDFLAIAEDGTPLWLNVDLGDTDRPDRGTLSIRDLQVVDKRKGGPPVGDR